MRRPIAAFVLLALLGCSPGGVPDPNAPVVCTKATCPKGWCTLKVSFHESCHNVVAEVLLNGALEPANASAGTTFASVGGIPVGSDAKFWVRSEKWQWGPISFVCKDPAKDGAYTLACSSTATGVPAATP